jgi:hypothetical protein
LRDLRFKKFVAMMSSFRVFGVWYATPPEWLAGIHNH